MIGSEHKKRVPWNKGIPNSGFKKGYTPYNKGIPNTPEQKKKISLSLTGKKKSTAHSENISKGKKGWKMQEEGKRKLSDANKGKKLSEETRKKMSETRIRLGIRPPVMYGEDNPNYIKDRTLLKESASGERRSSKYNAWRKDVCIRDKWKCKINNEDCSGRLEVHHILGFAEYPELRYKNNNGITLCHAHHPREKSEEKRLVPVFQKLVSVLQHIF